MTERTRWLLATLALAGYLAAFTFTAMALLGPDIFQP